MLSYRTLLRRASRRCILIRTGNRQAQISATDRMALLSSWLGERSPWSKPLTCN